MRNIFLAIFILNIVSCKGQNAETSTNKVNSKEYLEVIYKQCPKADIIEVEYQEDGYVEVEYMCNGQVFEAGVNNNAIIYSETKANPADVPLDKISRKLEKKYQGWILDEISEVTASDTAFLKVEIMKDGLEQNLYFTKDGKWFKMKNLIQADNINLNDIRNNKYYLSAGYSFFTPDSSYEMPDLLREISGITLASNYTVFCVQDELGAVFEYDFAKEDINKIHRFTDIGDFEDVAVNKDMVYVLRSDGNVFKFSIKNSSKVEQFMLSLNSLNIEGLHYSDGYLYVACKDPLVSQNETKRSVYRVKDNNKAIPELYLEIDLNNISQFISKNYPELALSDVLFNPSALAIHPVTKELYLLSATDRLIAVYKDKQLKYAIPLPAEEYYKPEGLIFYPNGDMLISSEGDKRGLVKGNIVLLKYKRN